MSNESSMWSGQSSQILNLTSYLACTVLFILIFWLRVNLIPESLQNYSLLLFVIPVGIAFWKWISLRTTRYELSTERLTLYSGVFNKTTEVLELYRVKDYRVEQPFFLRLFGLGNLKLVTSDKSSPTVELPAIFQPQELRELARAQVEKCRDRKRVREIDFE